MTRKIIIDCDIELIPILKEIYDYFDNCKFDEGRTALFLLISLLSKEKK